MEGHAELGVTKLSSVGSPESIASPFVVVPLLVMSPRLPIVLNARVGVLFVQIPFTVKVRFVLNPELTKFVGTVTKRLDNVLVPFLTRVSACPFPNESE